MSKLRLIQAGVGGFGATWTNIVPASAEFEYAALVDVNQKTLDEAGDKLSIPPSLRFNDLSIALKEVRADALLTVTPPAVHLDHARRAFEAGLHVMTEKPIADSILSAEEMVRLADAAKLQLVVSQNYRYRPAAALLRKLLEDRAIGELGHGHIDFYIPADFTGSFRENMPHVLLVDMAIHHLDLLRYITGKDIEQISAHTFKPNWSWYGHNPGLKMLLSMTDGVQFSYSGDWSARGRNTDWNGDWRIQCTDGSLHWIKNKVTVARSSRGFKDDTAIEEITIPPIELDGQRATLANFAAAIRTGVPAPTSGRDNLQSFGAVMAAVQSAETGRAVRLDELLA